MYINVVVHQCDSQFHPGAGGMWRWAVHIGHDFANRETCLNAGAELDPELAAARGQAVAVAAAKVAELCGALSGGTTVFLDHDPTGAVWPIVEVLEI
jgi:hypothetical protein